MFQIRPTLRRALAADRDAIESLMQRSVRALCIRDYSADQIATMTRRFGFAQLEETLIDDGTYFVAESAGAIVGCGGWTWRELTYHMRDEDTGLERSLPHPSPGSAAIRSIFVDPRVAGRGIGGLLVMAAEASARKVGFDAFELRATLTGAPLYRKLGYRAGGLFSCDFASESRFHVIMMYKQDRQNTAHHGGPLHDIPILQPDTRPARPSRPRLKVQSDRFAAGHALPELA